MSSPSTSKKNEAEEMSSPLAPQQDSPTLGSSPAGNEEAVDEAESEYKIPTPRPTSIFMSKSDDLVDSNDPKAAKRPLSTYSSMNPKPTFAPRPRVEALLDSGARIWTREDLTGVEGHVEALVRGLGDTRAFPFRCIDDSIVTIEDVNPHSITGKPAVAFRMYQDILYSAASSRDKASLRGLAICGETKAALANIPPTEHQLHQIYLNEKKIWEESKSCANLKLILSTSNIPAKITRMVCFGLGSFENAYRYTAEPTHHRSIVQHCAALTMAEVIHRKIGKRIQVYVQDPSYSVETKRILGREEIRVIDCYGAAGFTYVDDDTFVYSVHPDVPVKQIVADLARPAIMVWDKVTTAEEEKAKLEEPRLFVSGYVFPWLTDNDSPRTQALIKGYKETPFPDDKGHFDPGLSIYVRKD